MLDTFRIKTNTCIQSIKMHEKFKKYQFIQKYDSRLLRSKVLN